MNHKRGRPKKARAGCLFCKPHKGSGVGRGALTVGERRAVDVDLELIEYEISGSELKAPPDECQCFYGYLCPLDDAWEEMSVLPRRG